MRIPVSKIRLPSSNARISQGGVVYRVYIDRRIAAAASPGATSRSQMLRTEQPLVSSTPIEQGCTGG